MILWRGLKLLFRRYPPTKAAIERPTPPAAAELSASILAARRVRELAEAEEQRRVRMTGNPIEGFFRGGPPGITTNPKQKPGGSHA